MRRREKRDDSMWPAWLIEYRAEDWPRPQCHTECAYWVAAFAWLDEHPEGDLPPSVGPDVPFHPELL